MGERPTQSRKRGQGGNSPLAGSRGGAPLWGLGQRPNCCSSNPLKKRSQQGAGSEASLPVTLRLRRCAPQLALPTPRTLSRQMGRDRVSVISYFIMLLLKCRDFATVEATRGLPLAPSPPSACTLHVSCFFLLLAFSCGRRIHTVGRSGASAQSLLPSESCQRTLSGASLLTFCR